ncbi:MAG: NAD(P)-binding domain-containing protein, partial [Actinomycetota bacterium]
MRIAVLGTGMVGQSLAGGFARVGHDVVIGTRDPGATIARREPDAMGAPGFGVWYDDHSD